MVANVSTSEESAIETQDPLVSVVLGNYNYGRFLQQSIDSVLGQTYKNIELIVVDDGSIDNSRDIIQQYGDRLIAILQDNTGQESTFNAGIERATGEIICFLDADDYFHPEKVARVVQAFQNHPEWGQIGHCWLSINSEGQVIGRSTSNVLSQGNVKDLLLHWGRYASAISSGLSCRRSVLNQVMPLKKGWGVDTYLNVTMPFYTQIGCINEPLMYYRMHGNNMRAYNDNLEYLTQQRKATAQFINETAALAGIAERFDIAKDADYRSYQIMQRGKVSVAEGWQIMMLSLQESWAIKRGFQDALIRFLNRTIAAFLPRQGKLILKMGLQRYVRWRILGQKPRY